MTKDLNRILTSNGLETDCISCENNEERIFLSSTDSSRQYCRANNKLYWDYNLYVIEKDGILEVYSDDDELAYRFNSYKDFENWMNADSYHIDIYQLPIENENIFRRLDMRSKEVDINEYKLVWSECVGDTFNYNVLEDIYTKFNVNHPKDYKARSLSLSDIIKVYKVNPSKFLKDVTYYYCDAFEWKKL